MTQVETAPHELQGRWKFPQWGLQPYWAISSLMLGEPFEGYHEFTREVNGEPWSLKVKYQKSGFAPRRTDDIDAERLYEWDIIGRGKGERKCSFNISPRFPNVRHWDTGEKISLPWTNQVGEVEGVDVEFSSSNVEPDDVPDLLREFYRGIFEEAAEAVNPHHFNERPHEASTISMYERYVRLFREWGEKLTQSQWMERMTHLLTDLDGVEATIDINNGEVTNHQNRVMLNSEAASQMLPGHTFGRKIEIYLLEDPDAVSNTHASYHPKFEVQFRKKQNDGDAIPWDERDRLTREIDESLMNLLNWSDIPIEPDGTGVYKPDSHFDAETVEEPVELYEDPLPKIEAQQEHLLMTTLRDMKDSTREVTEQVATDGSGRVEDLADDLGYHPATIYRAIQEAGDIFDLEDGEVSFRVRKYRDELKSLVESAEYAIESFADRIQHVMNIADHVSESSPFQKWLAKNGAELEFDDSGSPKRLRIDTILSRFKGDSYENATAIASEAIAKWRHSGNDPVEITSVPMVWITPSGGTEAARLGNLDPDW